MVSEIEGGKVDRMGTTGGLSRLFIPWKIRMPHISTGVWIDNIDTHTHTHINAHTHTRTYIPLFSYSAAKRYTAEYEDVCVYVCIGKGDRGPVSTGVKELLLGQANEESMPGLVCTLW